MLDMRSADEEWIFTAVSPDDLESYEPYLILPNLVGEIYCPIIYVP
jgi:hypothetical protein